MGFGKLRAFLWPVHRHELKRFVPMLLMFFLVTFNYNVLRAAKDALVVTAPQSGAEAIPFIKVWAILPMAFITTFFFTRISNRLSRQGVFYCLMGIFIGFFLLFSTLLYPFQDILHPHAFADKLQALLPTGCKGFVAMIRNWTFTSFYVMSEMWSTLIMTVLMWGFANEVTSVPDAKRFYGLFGIAVNASGILSGQVSTMLSAHQYKIWLPFGHDGWSQAVILLNGVMILAGLICTALFWWLDKHGLGYQNSSPFASKQEETTLKMGLRKNFAYLAKSKYLIFIAVIVVTYNISINLVEVVWKDQVKQLYPDPETFNAYMGQVLTWIGVLATAASIFISGTVIRKFSWSTAAIIPPIIFLSTGIAFFTFAMLKDASWVMILGVTPLALSVFFGSLQNCLSRASKYTLFDATKELAFVPLSKESKLKGKAAIDGVGSRLGKSGGSLIHQSLLMVFGTIAASTPIVGVILLFAVAGWIISVRALGGQFQELAEKDAILQVPEEEPIAIAAAAPR